MYFYQFNIGDYQSHTAHLSDIEDLAYRRLLDWYYLHEMPISTDVDEVARQIRMRSHTESIAIVLREFFKLTDIGWINGRADIEIAKVNEKSDKARQSAKTRWLKKDDANALQPQSEGNATHNTIHNTHNTYKDANASMSGTAFPTCPHQKILTLYKKHLGHLQQPRVWEGNRATMLRQRWLQASKPSSFSPEGYKTESDGLVWWDSFFAYIANDTSLARGFETKDRTWRPDLPWILNATNFQKIIDGKYNK